MKAVSPMERLREQAEETLNQRTQQLGRLRQRSQQAQAQHRQLQQYQREYQQQLVSRAAGGGLPAVQLANDQHFIYAIERAARHADQQAAACQQAVAQALEAWKSERRRLKAFATLASRAVAAAQAEEQRRQQKIMDDFATQRFARKPTR